MSDLSFDEAHLKTCKLLREFLEDPNKFYEYCRENMRPMTDEERAALANARLDDESIPRRFGA